MNKKPLNDEEMLFFKYYTTGSTKGNRVKSAMKAGISQNYNTASAAGSKLSKDPRLKEYREQVMEKVKEIYKVDLAKEYYSILCRLNSEMKEAELPEYLTILPFFIDLAGYKDRETLIYEQLFQSSEKLDKMNQEQIDKELKLLNEELEKYNY